MTLGLPQRIWRALECLGGGKGLPSVLAALSGSSSTTSFTGFHRASAGDDYPQGGANFAQPAQTGVYVIGDIDSISVLGPLWDGGSASGFATGWIALTLAEGTPDQLRLRYQDPPPTGGTSNFSVNIPGTGDATDGPRFYWSEVDISGYRVGCDAPGVAEVSGALTELATGTLSAPSQLYVLGSTPARQLTGDIVALVTSGYLSDVDKTAVASAVSTGGLAAGVAELESRMNASGTATLHEWMRPTTSPVTAIEDGADPSASPIVVAGSNRMLGVER